MGQSLGSVCAEWGGDGPEGREDSGGHTMEGLPIGKREPFGSFIFNKFL